MDEGLGTKQCEEVCAECNNDQNKDQGTEENRCPWFINSPEHGNCLWRYIQDKSGPDGSMPELVQSQIANLLGWSNTKTHFAIKEATAELVAALKAHKAHQLLSPNHDPSAEVPIYSIDPIRSDSNDDE